MNLFELFVKIGVDDQASGTISKVTQGLGKGLVTAAKVSTATITAAGAAITTLGGIGLNYNKQMETYTSNFKVMLGDMQKATNKVQELKEFAAKTPFEMSDLANATQTLLAFGVESEKTSGIMQMLGDVSLGNSEKFQSLALVFGQVSSQGKLMGQDLLQMINAGFNPLQVISERTGESVASLKDKMSKGQIGIEEVTQAFKWATEEGGKFFNGMQEGSKTLEGRISTLKDNVVALLGEVFLPISETLTNEIIPSAIGAVDELANAFKEGGTVGLIEAGGAMIGDLVSGIVEESPKLISTADKLISSLVNSIKQNKSQITSGAVSIIKTLGEAILSLIPELAETSIDILMGLIDGIVENAPMLVDAAVSVIEKLSALLSDKETLTKLVDAAVEIIYQLSLGLIDSASSLLNAAINIVEALIEYLLSPENLNKIVEMCKTLVIAIAEGLVEMSGELAVAGTSLAVTLMESLLTTNWTDVGQKIAQNTIDGFKRAWGKFTDWFYETSYEISNSLYGYDLKYGEAKPKTYKETNTDLQTDALRNEKLAMKAIETAEKFAKAAKKAEVKIVEDAKDTADELAKLEEERLERQKTLRGEFLDFVEDTTSKMIDLEEEYQDKFEERTEKIKKSFDIFAKYEEQEKKSGTELIKNLYSQNMAIAHFYHNIERLEQRGASKSLIEEFMSRGVSSAGELSALIGMSDYQLERYFEAYADRERIAEMYATSQLSEEKQKLQSDLATMFESISEVYDANADELGISFIDRFVEKIKQGSQNIANALKSTISDAISQAMGTSALLNMATSQGNFTSSIASAFAGAIKGDSENAGFGVYLDGNLLVGGISDRMNSNLGENYTLDTRGVMA